MTQDTKPATSAFHIRERIIWEADRSVKGTKCTVIFDDDGDEICRFPASFSDEQIQVAMEIVENYYNRGLEIGGKRKLRQIQNALGITP